MLCVSIISRTFLVFFPLNNSQHSIPAFITNIIVTMLLLLLLLFANKIGGIVFSLSCHFSLLYFEFSRPRFAPERPNLSRRKPKNQPKS